jgi:hypothetical protein
VCRGWISRELCFIAKTEKEDGGHVHVGDNNIAPADQKTLPSFSHSPPRLSKTLRLPSPTSNQAVRASRRMTRRIVVNHECVLLLDGRLLGDEIRYDQDMQGKFGDGCSCG